MENLSASVCDQRFYGSLSDVIAETTAQSLAEWRTRWASEEVANSHRTEAASRPHSEGQASRRESKRRQVCRYAPESAQEDLHVRPKVQAGSTFPFACMMEGDIMLWQNDEHDEGTVRFADLLSWFVGESV